MTCSTTGRTAGIGINFHPPLAGQLNLATHAIFGSWMKDIPARRMASVIEFALTIDDRLRLPGAAVWGGGRPGHGRLAPAHAPALRPGPPDRHRHPGLLLWAATALAFWKGLHEPNGQALAGPGRHPARPGLRREDGGGRRARAAPGLARLAGHFPGLQAPGGRADWIDGVRHDRADAAAPGPGVPGDPEPAAAVAPARQTNLFVDRPASDCPGAILAVPLAVWIVRRLLGWLLPRSPVWGVERPALETWTAILAFAPVVGWLGNPAWWRETLPRLAHYYTLSTQPARRASRHPDHLLRPDLRVHLPWHNAWVLIGITVPLTHPGWRRCSASSGCSGRSAATGCRSTSWSTVVTLPVLRMLPTPAHDGVRLFLPTFFFLAAFAGWGTVALAATSPGGSARPRGSGARSWPLLVLAPAAWS